MNELSQRLQKAVIFLISNGYAKNDSDIARAIGMSIPGFNMAKTGARVPMWDTLLKFCDTYPINFEWIRTGEGGMVRKREAELMRKITELEKRIRELGG